MQVTGEETSNAVLVCFAPYEDPEIALAIVAEQGAQVRPGPGGRPVAGAWLH